MNRLDDYLQRINEGKIDVTLRSEMADEILELLEHEKASLGTREKTLIAEAISALSTSIDSNFRPNETDFRRCLTALQRAMARENEPDEPNSQRNDESETISHKMLVTTVKMIKGQIF